jgi:hypothetical protein
VVSKVGDFFQLTNHDLNTLVPSLLLGQQFSFPNNQLTIATAPAQFLDKTWDTANRTFDTGPGGTGLTPDGHFHGFVGLAVRCDPTGAPCPGVPGGGGKAPATAAQSLGQGSSWVPATATASTTSSDLDRAFLDYLLGR